ncbi:ABC transporter ATP-binding protein [Flavobacteriales bacterium]|jgi:lipoprotein-releasing system ATP-binding protein|nr:ABC transporter ATP-binding protein [Flavobacteriales bacterium]MDA9894079.1 ABC transporter ATP-binding protein [bacterium]MDC3389611.1 ABC transporter ATP-binding protein [Flavobacteriales bacterium]
MIQGVQIHKKFNSLNVLNGINISINQKEIVSIVGKSGAGKTTLLQILGTLEKPSSGEVLINGQNISKLNENELASFRNKNIGFIFQFHHLLPEFTALENVCIPAYISKTSKKNATERAKYLLNLMGVGERINHKPNELSGGEQQRVSVARALMNEPSVILADEPSGNLDSKSADQLHELFFKLRDLNNQTFIIVTHNNKLADLADKKVTLSDGLVLK